MGQFALSLVTKHFAQLVVPFAQSPYCVVLENSDHESEAHALARFESLLQTALERGLVTDAVVAHNTTQARALWHVRECIPLAQAIEGLNVKHDISVAVSRIPDFVRHTDALLQQAFPGVRLVNYGHLGDGNLHYNAQAPEGEDAARFLSEREADINALVYREVSRFNGSISAEHGIGSLKRDTLAQYKPAVALNMMRAIKTALDPLDLMNPRRVV
jgi:FAD/FMN-containing dehydrogenase